MFLEEKFDKFYTNEKEVKKLLKKLNDFISMEEFDFVIEPSAGSGSFLKNINHRNLLGIDIEPEFNKIKKHDWFEYKVSKKFKKVLVIGNPPFGKRNNLSIKFLKHAFSFDNVYCVAFILPNVFKKYTLQKYIPSNFFINHIIDLPINSFSFKGKSYKMHTSFFIISKNKINDLRQNKKISSKHFIFSNQKDYDFFIFGSAPKNIILKKDEISKNNRGYYIKSKIEKEKTIKNFKKCNWIGHSSTNGGVYWMTKTDIIENYIRKYEK